MNLESLRTEIEKEEYTGLSAAQIVALLNAPTITRWREVPKPDVENYIRNSKFSVKLRDFLTVKESLIAFQKLDLSLPENAAVKDLYNAAKEVQALFSGSITSINGQNPNIQLTIGGFVQAGIFTQAEASAFFAQFQYKVSRSQEQFGQFVTENDVQRVLLLPKAALVRSRRDSLNQQVAIYDALLSQLDAGIDVQVEGENI